MTRRVPLRNTQLAIETIKQDGGVILTDFSSIADVEKVNSDAFSYLSEIKANVGPRRFFLIPSQSHSFATHPNVGTYLYNRIKLSQ